MTAEHHWTFRTQLHRPTRSGAFAFAIAIVVVTVALSRATPATAATSASSSSQRPPRVLIVSIPTLTWADLNPRTTPHLLTFLDSAAIADLSTRADRQPAKLGAAYVTIGSGTRAAGDDLTDGEGLASDERFGGGTAGATYQQRTGADPRRGIVDLGIARIDGANAQLLYDAHPGALGDALAAAKYERTVVANGDGGDPDTSGGTTPEYFRSAVATLMDGAGRLPGGEVGPQLLSRDHRAPFGERLDNTAVLAAFLAGWHARSVAVVEASDLVRADRYSSVATATGNAKLREVALAHTDDLFGRLLEHVDLRHDVVMVVAPVPPTGNRSVTVAALRGPGVPAGLLRSATTRRSGFVTLADIAPTVLDRLGLPTPTTMEGRRMLVDAGHGSATARRDLLERANAQGLLRDDLVNPVTATVLWTAIVLAIACALLLLGIRRSSRAARLGVALVPWIALALIGFVVATLPATLFDFGEHGGKPAYWAFVILFAILFAGGCRLARRNPLDPLLVALTLLLTVSVVDQFSGAHLEFNSVFGYSATVGIRFSGIGNQSSALLATAAVLVASLTAWRFPSRQGTRLALATLLIAFVAVTPPLFGQDFGGTIATAPAFALLAWLLLGRRVTLRAVAALVGLLLLSGLAVGFLDLLRPSDQRTHVGRFFEKVGNEGFSGFSTVIERKGGENVATFSSPLYFALILVVVIAGIALWFRPPQPLQSVVARVPTLRAAAGSLVVLVALSYGLNDSGLAIPALMLALVAAAASYLLVGPIGQPGDGAHARSTVPKVARS